MNKKSIHRLMIEELTEKVKTQTITDHNDIIRETIKGISEEVRARRQKKEEEKAWRQRCKEYNMKKHQEKKEERAKEEAERIKQINKPKPISEQLIEQMNKNKDKKIKSRFQK